jgi:hypothetical protein
MTLLCPVAYVGTFTASCSLPDNLFLSRGKDCSKLITRLSTFG